MASAHCIALLLDKATNDVACAFNGVTAKWGVDDFKLDSQKAPPHMTVFRLMLDDRHLPQLIKAVEKVTAESLKGNVLSGRFNALQAYSNWLYLTATPVDIIKTPQLMGLHQAVADAAVMFRTGGFPAPHKTKRAQMASWHKYGYHRVGFAWHPHVTIRQVSDGWDEALERGGVNIDPFDLAWTAEKIVIARVVDGGILGETRHVIELPKNA